MKLRIILRTLSAMGATSDILSSEEIEIPEDQYASSLEVHTENAGPLLIFPFSITGASYIRHCPHRCKKCDSL